jgi:hypothetical protein
MLSRDARYLAAAVEGLIAWEWLVSGANKVLAGDFPQGLAATLGDGAKNNPNGWYVQLLNAVIIPHSVGFGYAIEFTELLIGLGLLIGTVLLLGPVRRKGDPQYHIALGEMVVASVAAVACAFLCVNFHFFMGDGFLPGVNTAKAFDEGISLDTLMPPLSLVVLAVNILVLCDMTSVPLAKIARAGWSRIWALASAGRRRIAGSHG